MTAAPDCIFCKIVAGTIACNRLVETEHALAFLDVNPLAEGHALVIPRQHAGDLRELPGDRLARVIEIVPGLTARILAAVGANAFNLLQNNGREAGQVVRHVHFHIIPRRPEDGLGYRWNAKSATADALAALAARIAAQT